MSDHAATKTILVTGGAGFIGGALVRHLAGLGHRIVNVDKLSYSSSLDSLRDVSDGGNYRFCRLDIGDQPGIAEILAEERPDAIVHLAAETHVDRSIDGPAAFIETNVVGTFRLLEAALSHFRSLDRDGQSAFRFHHVSTDEVFGDLEPGTPDRFTEETPYAPSSPYSASKAASDHLVRAWSRTYGLPVLISNCSNNYGPFQFPEKLIPLTILNALEGLPLPVYGNGSNVRDWLHVDDHARALERILVTGRTGESYNVGGDAERANIAVVERICDLLDERVSRRQGSRRDLITFVTDRPGHDRRYAIDSRKMNEELGWTARESFDSGLAATIDWYLANEWWWRPLREQRYAGERLGTASVAG